MKKTDERLHKILTIRNPFKKLSLFQSILPHNPFYMSVNFRFFVCKFVLLVSFVYVCFFIMSFLLCKYNQRLGGYPVSNKTEKVLLLMFRFQLTFLIKLMMSIVCSGKFNHCFLSVLSFGKVQNGSKQINMQLLPSLTVN